MSLSDLGIVASIASLIMAIVAIWLSLQFFLMAQTNTKEATAAAKDVQASVERLEKLFDRLYSDTFGMVRDTFSDMRRRVLPDPAVPAPAQEEIESRTAQIIEGVKAEMRTELERLTARAGSTDAQLQDIRQNLEAVMERAIAKSSTVESEARESAVRSALIQAVAVPGGTTMPKILEELTRAGFNDNDIIQALFDLRRDGVITWLGRGTGISWGQTVTLAEKPRDSTASDSPKRGRS